MIFTEKQKNVLNTEGHCLVLGGPGSGKTTVSILKASKIVEAGLNNEQKVLFLSFARATVARVSDGIRRELNIDHKISSCIEVDTYHSFFWRILKGHGYLLGLPRSLDVLLPADVAGALSDLRSANDQTRDDGLLELTDEEFEVLLKVAYNDGRVGFDLFAPLLAELLQKFPRICDLIALRYPYIILDEFQDTSDDQWEIVKQLGKASTCLALADPEQRIFDFIATDPERPNHFRAEFDAPEIDLGGYSHRSRDTDISLFGDDILRGKFSQLVYDGVKLIAYPRIEVKALAKLFSEVLAARKRAIEKSGEDWSVAVLVPTKPMTKKVSDHFNEGLGKLPSIPHTAVIERDAAILSAHCIGYLLEKRSVENGLHGFVQLVSNFYRGRSGDTPSSGHLKTAASFLTDYAKRQKLLAQGKNLPLNSKLRKLESTYRDVLALHLSGDPRLDWVSVRDCLENGACKQLHDIAMEARNLRFLERGTQLRLGLAGTWDGTMSYPKAYEITKDAFVQEHFASAGNPEHGVVVMNLHKAKGKQFDETILFEDAPVFARGVGLVRNSGRYVRGNIADEKIGQARKNFRMAVTRSRYRTTVLTPTQQKCVLISELM